MAAGGRYSQNTQSTIMSTDLPCHYRAPFDEKGVRRIMMKRSRNGRIDDTLVYVTSVIGNLLRDGPWKPDEKLTSVD